MLQSPQIMLWRCLKHRAELAAGDMEKEVNGISHFMSFMDKLNSLHNEARKKGKSTGICTEGRT